MLRVINGLRSFNHSNATINFPNQSITAQANGAAFDSANFSEVIAVGMCQSVTGSGTGQLVIQESNESSANFANINTPINAVMNFNVANTVRFCSLNKDRPTRKRYLRLSAFNTTNAVSLSGVLIGVQPSNNINVANNALYV